MIPQSCVLLVSDQIESGVGSVLSLVYTSTHLFTSAAVSLSTNESVCLSCKTQFKVRTDAVERHVWIRCVYTHTHTHGGNDIIGFTALDVLITTLNQQLIKAEFLGSIPAPPRRSFLSCSLLRKGKHPFKAGIPESIAKGKQVKPCDRERVRTAGDLAQNISPVDVWDWKGS